MEEDIRPKNVWMWISGVLVLIMLAGLPFIIGIIRSYADTAEQANDRSARNEERVTAIKTDLFIIRSDVADVKKKIDILIQRDGK